MLFPQNTSCLLKWVLISEPYSGNLNCNLHLKHTLSLSHSCYVFLNSNDHPVKCYVIFFYLFILFIVCLLTFAHGRNRSTVREAIFVFLLLYLQQLKEFLVHAKWVLDEWIDEDKEAQFAWKLPPVQDGISSSFWSLLRSYIFHEKNDSQKVLGAKRPSEYSGPTEDSGDDGECIQGVMDWIFVLAPDSFICWSFSPQGGCIWDGAYREVISIKWGCKSEAPTPQD